MALSPVEEPELKGYFALRSPVGGTRLSILRLASENELYGGTLSPVFVFYLGLLAILLFVLMVSFERMRQNAARLQLKFVETNSHRAALAEHNFALSQEIERREIIEAALQRQREALDKTNAELRIAAAAFDAQEGMIVTDSQRRYPERQPRLRPVDRLCDGGTGGAERSNMLRRTSPRRRFLPEHVGLRL